MQVRARGVGIFFVAMAIATAGIARADGPEATCRALRSGDRVRVNATLTRFFDAELLRLVRLGLEGRVHVTARLYRHRTFWLDEELDSQSVELSAKKSRSTDSVLLDGRAADLEKIDTETLSLRTTEEGRLVVEVTARLEVVTAQSLRKMTGFLVNGKNDQGEGRGVIAKGVLDAIAGDLRRTAEGKCEVVR